MKFVIVKINFNKLKHRDVLSKRYSQVTYSPILGNTISLYNCLVMISEIGLPILDVEHFS